MKALKKKLILSYLERKKRTEPFDAQAAENFSLSPEDGININNSHFFTASSPSETLSLRLGMRNQSEWEIFVLYRNGNRFLVHEKDSYPPSECPVRFECLEVGKRWAVSFKGRLRDSASSEVKDAEIHVVFDAQWPIYDFTYHADQFNGMAESIAREKWNKDFFAELSRNNQRHYEQPGHINGTLDFGSEHFDIDLCCVRDHSFGCREWDLMNDHIWLLGITPEGRVLCFSIVNYPRLKRIYSGYTNLFSDKLETLRDYEILSYDHNSGLGGESLKLRCIFPEGKKVDVSIRRDFNVKCLFGGGKYAFQEGLGEFSFDFGAQKGCLPGRGTLEYGFNLNPERWEGFSRICRKPGL